MSPTSFIRFDRHCADIFFFKTFKIIENYLFSLLTCIIFVLVAFGFASGFSPFSRYPIPDSKGLITAVENFTLEQMNLMKDSISEMKWDVPRLHALPRQSW